MGHDPFFHALLLLGLLCLFRLLSWVWLRSRPATSQTTPTPTMAIKPCSKVPQPFPGLTHTPSCDACEHAAEPCEQAPSAPPPRMVSTQGRRRAVDTSCHFCPNPTCSYTGWVGWGNICANGHPGGSPWRQLHCRGCKGYFQETHGTPFHGKRVPPERLVWAVGALAEGLGIRSVARVFEVDPNTVLQWLVEAADHLQAFSRYCLHDVHVSQVQLDELLAVLSEVKAGQVSEAEAIERMSRSSGWVWGAVDPQSKLVLAIDVGERTLAMAQCVVHQVVQVLTPGCVPLFLTDGFKEYATALLSHFGHWMQPPRQRAQGPAPKPRWMPLPQLCYAQVVKT
jgi:hypothetical protein